MQFQSSALRNTRAGTASATSDTLYSVTVCSQHGTSRQEREINLMLFAFGLPTMARHRWRRG